MGARLPLSVRLSLGTCRGLLVFWPRHFRRGHGAFLIQNTRDLLALEHCRRGATGIAMLWPRLLRDLLAGGLAERARSRVSLPSTDSLPMLDSLLLDLRFARRSMAARPGLTALAIVTLALGIGASSAMFSVVDGVLLRPLPYPGSERLTALHLTIPEWLDHEALGRGWNQAKWSHTEFVDWVALQESFEVASLFGLASGNVVGLGEAEQVGIGLAGLDLFRLLGAAPAHGRFFTPDDEASDGRVVVVSHAFFQERLGADPAAIGRTIELAGGSYTLIGVLTPGFVPPVQASIPLWIPIFDNRPGGLFPGNTGDMDHVFRAYARLREGVSPEMAEEETARLVVAVGGEGHFTRHGANVVPRLQDQTRGVRTALLAMMVAVVLLLLVACANVGTFLLGRAIDRQQEIAIRGALGAGSGRIVRQLLTESTLLGLAGGALGLIAAGQMIPALRALAPAGLPRIDTVSLDLRAVGFAIGATLLSGMLFGLAPALSLGRADLARAIGAGRFGSRGRSRMQAGMVIAEVTVATVLLVGAGLLTRSFLSLNGTPVGFDPEGVVALEISADLSSYRDAEGNFDDGAARAYHAELVDAIRALPGVADAAITRHLPFGNWRNNNNIVPEGYVLAEGENLLGRRRFVSPNFHALMRIPLVQGRYLDLGDARAEAASVVLINEEIADRFFAGDAVGKKLTWYGQDSLIVGVVANVRDNALSEEAGLQFYAAPERFGRAGGAIVVRAERRAEDLLDPIRGAVNRFDPELPITRLQPVTDTIAGTLASVRYRTRLIAVFALLAALLSVLGLYGVTARAVAARTRELGIRLALGAAGSRVVGDVLGDGARLAAIGATAGLGISLLATRLLEGLLYGVQRNDPVTLAAIALVVGAMAVLASLVPSLRASRVDPVTALRTD